MNITEHLLSKLAEECAETIQRCTKAQFFGLDERQKGHPEAQDNRERLLGEVADILGIVERMQEFGILPKEIPRELILRKHERLDKYMAYSRELGTLV